MIGGVAGGVVLLRSSSKDGGIALLVAAYLIYLIVTLGFG